MRSLAALIAALSCACHPDPVRASDARPAVHEPTSRLVPWSGKGDPAWSEVDALVNDQKLEAASEKAGALLARARAARDGEGVTRALVRLTELRVGLHGYEQAVRSLQSEAWPDDLLSQTLLHLYYAQALDQYAAAYSWEIRKRERQGGAGGINTWTYEELRAEAGGAFAWAFARREALGAVPTPSLRELVQVNGYPAGIRPTVRDAVTYLWAQHLADRGGWRPEHESGLWSLEAGALARGPDLAALARLAPAGLAGGGEAAVLASSEVHPVARLAYVLADLERWHAPARRGAALEAHLERTRRLHAAFGAAEDRGAVVSELETALPGFRADPWWSEGMATLADLTRQSGKANALVQARALAEQGRVAGPETTGGRHCASIVAQLDGPELSLEASASDAPGRRSLAVGYKNLERVWFRAYRRDVLAAVAKTNDFRLYDNDTARALLESATPSATFSAALPRTVDLDRHRAYVTPPMTAPGLYLVVASAREDFGKANNVLTGAHLILGDLVVLLRAGSEPDLEVEVLAGARGAAAAGVEVSLLRYDYREGHRVVATARTGNDGLARVRRSGDGAAYVVLARRGDDVAVKPAGYYTKAPEVAPAREGALVYTDRSIYRPGQTLHWKVVAYAGDQRKGKLRVAPGRDVTVTLVDANGQTVTEAKVRTSDYGTAAGELALPAGRLLGAWTVRASLGGQASIRVEEYKRPTFEAKLSAPGAARLGQSTTLTGEARYYFGLPVASGSVRWRVTREPQYPWWWWLWSRPGGGATEVVAAGTSRLADDGTFSLSFVARADPRLAGAGGVTYRYLAHADVTDDGGETRAAERAVRLGFTSVEASVELPATFLRAGLPATATIHRSTLDGEPAPGEGEWTLAALKAPAEPLLPADEAEPPRPGDDPDRFRTPGDLLPPRWQSRYEPDATLRRMPSGAEQARGKVTVGGGGQAEVKLPALAAGAYRLRYVTRDPAGAEVVAERELLVAAPRAGVPLPFVLRAEKGTVAVGETARLLVASGFPDARIVVDFYRDGARWDRRVLSGKEGGVVEVPVTAELRGGFSVVATTLRDHQVMTSTARFFVPWDDRELRVELSSFRDRLRPGEHETWRVTVRGPGKQDHAVAAAELLAYMYDRSLDAFVPHVPPRPLELFPDRTAARGVDSSLSRGVQAWFASDGFARPPPPPSLEPDRLRALGRYGVGGPGRRGGVNRMMAQPLMHAPAAAPAGIAAAPAVTQDAAAPQRAAEPETKPAPAAPPGEVQLRGDFSETAFFAPRLLTDRDGAAAIELTVPESVTSWRLWVHALTKDLASGSVAKEARTVKDLMVRPYLPRFVREGDAVELRVAVNNAGDQPLTGELRLELVDPRTQQSVAERFSLREATRTFTAPPKGAATVRFTVTAPSAVGDVVVRASARAGALSDGEQRPVPVLPGRMHLTQSRFATLQGQGERTLRFADLAGADDPSRINERLVVTLDAQLFYGVLAAVPYLVEYPYECTEQTLNRYLSTAILGSLFDRYPAVARLASELAKRTTRLERFDAPDPTRSMALEETPWLIEARGGEQPSRELARVLDPAIARAQREASIARLEKLQTSSGGFPWFPGGPPSPYMTLYLLQGFARGAEFGVAPPAGMVQRGLAYLHRHWLDELVKVDMAGGTGFERVSFLAFVLSSFAQAKIDTAPFTDADRGRLLDYGFAHWREHAPRLKGYLALTLGRAGRTTDARLVWSSVMDSAKTAEDQGTFWAPEDRSWLWYNDTIETHAFALRVGLELTPEDPRLSGLVTWLFLNKKLNHWKSTRATAEVLYSLARWLGAHGDLGGRDEASVTLAGEVTRFVFEPERYTGKRNQLVREGAAIDPGMASTVVSKPGPGLLFASATWSFSTDRLPAEGRGDFLSVSRRMFRRVATGREPVLEPLAAGTKLVVGDEVVVQLEVSSKHPAEYVHLRDPRPAGCEPVEVLSGYRWDLGIGRYQEVRDSGTNFFFDSLPQGTYTLSYRLRATHAGTFKAAPATLQPMYAPEFAAYSAGARIPIAP